MCIGMISVYEYASSVWYLNVVETIICIWHDGRIYLTKLRYLYDDFGRHLDSSWQTSRGYFYI